MIINVLFILPVVLLIISYCLELIKKESNNAKILNIFQFLLMNVIVFVWISLLMMFTMNGVVSTDYMIFSEVRKYLYGVLLINYTVLLVKLLIKNRVVKNVLVALSIIILILSVYLLFAEYDITHWYKINGETKVEEGRKRIEKSYPGFLYEIKEYNH